MRARRARRVRLRDVPARDRRLSALRYLEHALRHELMRDDLVRDDEDERDVGYLAGRVFAVREELGLWR